MILGLPEKCEHCLVCTQHCFLLGDILCVIHALPGMVCVFALYECVFARKLLMGAR